MSDTDQCPVCDDPVRTKEYQGCCSDDCLTTAAERQHESFCEDFYGGSSPVTIREHQVAGLRWEYGL